MNLRDTLLAPILAAILVGPAGAQATEVRPKPTGPVHVLVLTPESERLASRLIQRNLIAESVATAPVTVETAREDRRVLDTLRTGAWDFVVVGGQTTFENLLVIDGEIRVGDPSEFLREGRLVVEEIRRAGARAILLVPPARPGAPAVDRSALDWAYQELGRSAGAVLAPVGEAFDRARRRRPDLALFDSYGEGWSSAGFDLAASVVEIAVTGRVPAAEGPDGSDREAGPLAAETRRLLDDAAWAAVRDLAAAGGSRAVPSPPFPRVPILARGDELASDRLRGTWRGPLRLYPWPATLEIDFLGPPDAVRISGRVTFADGRPALDFRDENPRLGERMLTLRNPVDLAGGRTSYRLVARNGHLIGLAELVTDDGGVYAIGELELRRVGPGAAKGTE